MGAWRSKLSVPRTSPTLSKPYPPPTASVLAQETRDGARESSGVLSRIPPSEAVVPLRKRLRSAVPEDGGDAKRIKDLEHCGVPDTALVCDDGQYQLASASAGPESLLFSCQPSGAASDMVLGPSGSVQPMSLFKLDGAKHKIFLSHSGAQKDFVEQLCVDLERKGYFFPFFDQRHHSLPKGKDFAPLIIEAARLCHVAVIVLSKEFLSSKWPMIELAEFYATQEGTRGGGKLKLLPLFFKLSIEEVKDEDRWMPIWKAHAACDDRIHLSKWRAAVKALCKLNGLAFGKVATTEVAYRKCIVESIFKVSPPDLLFGNTISIAGYGGMCEAMSREFVEDSTIGARVLGIYGLAGLGKTMLAEALHDYFYREFMGKVCYVDMRHGSRVGRQKWVLKMICGFDKDMVDCIGADVVKGLRQMESFVKREPVFLILDNVTSNAHLLHEVQDYLKMGFHRESRILITSSSQAILEYLLPNMQLYTPMPTLTIEEARALFLNRAAPMKAICELTKQEQDILGICIQNCWFDSEEGGFYHPMALTALGDFFCRLGRSRANPLFVWKDHLEKEMDLVKDVLRSSKDLFGILGLQFSTFDFSEKLLFLDSALFSRTPSSPDYFTNNGDLGRLCRLHGESQTTIKVRLMTLQNSGMIELRPVPGMDLEDEYFINVPNLYRKFAEWYATDHKMNGLKNAFGVFELGGMNSRVDSSTPTRCWSNLIRLRIFDMSLATARLVGSKRMQRLSKLVVLQLFHCDDLTTLNLEGFDCLREVQVLSFPQLVTLTLFGASSEDDYVGIYDSLQYMLLHDLPSLVHMPDLRPCTSVHTFYMSECPRVINFEGAGCPCLKVLLLYDLHPIHFEKLLAFKCLQSLVALFIYAISDVDNFQGYWQDRGIELKCEVTLEGKGPCAKFLKELCLLLDGSKNMICTYFYSRI